MIEPKAKYERRQTGLEQLLKRGKISQRQREAGEHYGGIWREAQMEGQACIKSALGGIDEARGSGLGQMLTPLRPAEYVAGVRRAYHDANTLGLRSQDALVAACEVICGKEWTPQMVTPDRSAQLQIETSLRIALDMLDGFWREGAGQSAAQSVAA